jgi:hypothetical protein
MIVSYLTFLFLWRNSFYQYIVFLTVCSVAASRFCFMLFSCFILQPRRWRGHVLLKHQLTFTGLDMSQKTGFIRKLCVGFEVLTVVILKIMIWVVIPCSSVDVQWCFRGIYHVYLLGPRVSQAKNQQESGMHMKFTYPMSALYHYIFYEEKILERNWDGLKPMHVMAKFRNFTWLTLQENHILYLQPSPPGTVLGERHVTIIYGHQTRWKTKCTTNRCWCQVYKEFFYRLSTR